MIEYPVEIGRAAISTAGRDKDRYFVIIGIIDEQYVYIADGELRTKDHPKKKKLKHLRLCSKVFEGIAGKLKTGVKVFDAEIRSVIRSFKSENEA